jgi:electron-transferring-flavoprotein dehydrogenase
MVIEKGSSIGSHTLSGAVIKPDVFRELLPDVAIDEIPFDSKVTKSSTLFLTAGGGIKSPVHAPYMGNSGNYTASLGQVCRFLADKATEKGVGVYPGFAMSEICYDDKGRVCGAKAIDTGVDHDGKPMDNFQPGTVVEAGITIFAEGSRGSLTKQLIEKFDLAKGKNPQMYSLGCKELWSVPEGRIKPGEVYHTLGYPLNLGEFGGGFVYGLKDNKVAVGLVVGLDYTDPAFDIHAALQVYKQHKTVRRIIEGGKLIEYGAKTLPEGGLFSLPKLYIDGALIVGDAAGFLAMPALKGVHLAMKSGMLAAETVAEALAANDFSEAKLADYEKRVMESSIYKELKPVRNFRQAFSKGLIGGGFKFASQLITGGAGFCGRLKAHEDKDATKTLAQFKGKPFAKRFAGKLDFDKELTFDKVTDIYFSGVAHDEHQVSHLHVNNPATFKSVNIEQYGAPCQHFCPAEVYEVHTDKSGNRELRIHFENCVHCKTCDIKSAGDGITWNVPYGGNGPDYQNM